MNPVGKLVDELRRNPVRFHATGGYERLLDALREGHAPDALTQLLREGSDLAGDLLWTVAELDMVEPFVHEARKYLDSADKGTAAYAMEIVLRGAREDADLRAALERLRVCDVAVCEHAVRTLAGVGSTRLREILAAAGYPWTEELAEKLAVSISREEIERYVFDPSRDRQVVGLALVTLAREQDASVGRSLSLSEEAWIRGYGEWLARK